MEKYYDEFCEILDEQIKKIAKKGDITPQELDNVYKASAIVLDMETKKAMKKAEKGGSEEQQMGANAINGGYSQRDSYNSYEMRRGRNSNRSNESYERGQSNHYPWFMYHDDGMSRGNSYSPVWNQDMHDTKMMDEMSNDMGRNSYNSYRGTYDGMSNARRGRDGDSDGRYSEDGSYRRGRDARGRYTSRDRGYSREAEKERMIDQLEEMMDNATTEKERKAIMRCIDKLDS